MDITNFINSKDIRKYLRDTGYQFNSLEAAWLIFQCKMITMPEKHAAWKQLIADMPDCEMPKRDNCRYQKSLHEFLKKYMQIQNDQYEAFTKEESGAVYQYQFYCKDDCSWCEEYDSIFATEADCWEEIEEDMDLGIERIIIRKSFIGKSNRYVSVEYRPDKTVVSVDSSILSEDDSAIIYESFEGLWFDFPVPFEKGDIVIERLQPGPYERVSEAGAFVVRGMTPWENERNDKYKNGTFGDNSDMNAWGFFQDEDGRIFSEVMENYMDLEYYEGPIEGRMRLLKAISSYLKEKIDLTMLLTTYRKVILDEFTKDVMLTSWFSEEELKDAGLSDCIRKKTVALTEK